MQINWTILSGDASIGSTSGNTAANGQASATIDLGPTPGTVTVQAQRNDFPTIVQVFTINSTLTRTLAWETIGMRYARPWPCHSLSATYQTWAYSHLVLSGLAVLALVMVWLRCKDRRVAA